MSDIWFRNVKRINSALVELSFCNLKVTRLSLLHDKYTFFSFSQTLEGVEVQILSKIVHTVPNDHSRTVTRFPMKMRSLWEGKTYAKSTTSPLNLCYISKTGLDLLILKIWGLLVKGFQSYQLSKLEVTRKSLPTGPGPSRTSWPGFELYRGQMILKVWWPVILQPFDQWTPNFQHWKI